MPDGPLLRTHQPRRARAQRDFHWVAPSIELNQPDRCRPRHRDRPRWFSQQNCLVVGCAA